MKNLIGSNNPNWKGGKSKCVKCEKELSYRYSSTKKNLKCRSCWKIDLKNNPQNHPNYKGGTNCIDCNKSIFWGQKRCSVCFHKNMSGKNHPAYKEKLTNYKYLHLVIQKLLGNPIKCIHCGSTESKLEWANKTGKYLRNANDWLSLCKSCHRKYDIKNKLFNKF